MRRFLGHRVVLAAITLLAFAVTARTSETGEFQSAVQEAVDHYETKAGQQYRDDFTKAIDSAVAEENEGSVLESRYGKGGE